MISLLWSGLAARAQQDESKSATVHYYSQASEVDRAKLAAVLSGSLSFYVDQSASLNEDVLVWKKKPSEILKDLNSIVKSGIKYYQFKELNAFKSFSDDVKMQIDKMHELSFSQSTEFNRDWSEAELVKRRYIFFQKEINQLKLLMDAEIGNFSNHNLLVYAGSDQVEMNARYIDSLLASTAYQSDAMLGMKPSEWSEATKDLLRIQDESSLGTKSSNKALSEFERELLKMIESNNARLDKMQSQMDQMRNDQLAIFQEQQKATNNQLQAQIDDLRGLVVELVRLNNSPELASAAEGLESGGNLSLPENLPSSISIYFEKNSSELNAASQLMLTEVIDILARNGRMKVLLTGWADQSGDATRNLELSRKRAGAVKSFLAKSGLKEDRFVVKYYGASKSQAENASDRKVSIEFLFQ
jgi:outer membrane protein OmpA-like peptidoglycan-associated protein